MPAVSNQDAEWGVFNRITFWREPLVTKILPNLKTYTEVAERASIIHVNRAYPYTGTIVAAGRLPGRPLIVDMEDWDGFGGYTSYAQKHGIPGWLLTLYEIGIPRAADAVLVVSNLLYLRMLHAGVPRSRLFLIPNGYDEELFHPNVSAKGIRDQYGLKDNPLLIYAGTFWEFERGIHEIALAAFKQVTKRIPNAKLLIMGPGGSTINNLVTDLGIENQVIFTGFVSRERVPQLIAASDLAIHVISEHGFHKASSPMIIPEYMAMGKCIVAPRVGELTTMLGGGAGYLVDKPESSLLASAIVEVLNNESLRIKLGNNAAERAAQSYSYTSLTKRLEEAYETAMSRPRPRRT